MCNPVGRGSDMSSCSIILSNNKAGSPGIAEPWVLDNRLANLQPGWRYIIKPYLQSERYKRAHFSNCLTPGRKSSVSKRNQAAVVVVVAQLFCLKAGIYLMMWTPIPVSHKSQGAFLRRFSAYLNKDIISPKGLVKLPYSLSCQNKYGIN